MSAKIVIQEQQRIYYILYTVCYVILMLKEGGVKIMILRKVQEGIVLPNIKTRYKSQQKCLVIKGMSHHSTFPLFSPGSHKKTGSWSNCNGFSLYNKCVIATITTYNTFYIANLYTCSKSIYNFLYVVCLGKLTLVVYTTMHIWKVYDDHPTLWKKLGVRARNTSSNSQ